MQNHSDELGARRFDQSKRVQHDVHFDFGVTTSYGSSTSSANAGAGLAPVAVSSVLNGLTPATLYHYRIVATNTGGTTTSSDLTLTTSAPLPIQLTSFTASPEVESGKVDLAWSTASEVNNYGYYVQRSAFATSGFVDLPGGFVPGSGTSLTETKYSWIDQNPLSGSNYYLLKQVDLDGSFRFSDPLKVVVSPVAGVDNSRQAVVFALGQNYPNPFNPTTRITFSVDKAGFTSLKVYNILGVAVATLFDGMAQSGKHIRCGSTGQLSPTARTSTG